MLETMGMENSRLLVGAMAEKCRDTIQGAKGARDDMPAVLGPRHLVWMCNRIEQAAGDWPITRLHRWIGFVQAGMIASGIVNLAQVKTLFDDAKKAFGGAGPDIDLIDHLNPDSSFEFELGGQG